MENEILKTMRQAAEELKEAGCDMPELDTEVLLAHALGCERFEIYTNKCRTPFSVSAELKTFQKLVERRKRREPVAYIIGHKEFWSLKLKVTSDVLAPRPETEKVVETALTFLSEKKVSDTFWILDLCTGSGCIAAALASELPHAQFVVTDISEKALAVAKENLKFAEGRITFLPSNLFENVRGKFDLIVSNPPYIPSAELPHLMPEVCDFEPRLALDGGADGLDFVRQIRHDFSEHLKPGGCCILENGAKIEIWKNSSSKGESRFTEMFA